MLPLIPQVVIISLLQDLCQSHTRRVNKNTYFHHFYITSLTVGQLYQAVRLGVPSSLATFRTVLRDKNGTVLDTRLFTINLNTGASLDWYVSIVIGSGGPSTRLSPGWYVSTDRGHRSTLLSGVSVNSIDTWDVSRHGWVKQAPGEAGLVSHDLGQLSQSWRPRVDNCVSGEVTGHWSAGVMVDKTEVGGRDVMQEHPFISSVKVWQRHVEVEHSQSPVLSLTCQHSTQACHLKYSYSM